MYLEAYCTHIIVYIVASKVCTYPCFKEVVCAFFPIYFNYIKENILY